MFDLVLHRPLNSLNKNVRTTVCYPFKRQPLKMVKHTLTIRLQQPTNCLSAFDHFVGLVRKGLLFNAFMSGIF